MGNVQRMIEDIKKKTRLSDLMINPGASSFQILKMQRECMKKFGCEAPDQYLHLLKMHDGLSVEGIVVYSTQRYENSGEYETNLAFIDMNLIARDVSGVENFIIFGESDQDEYVLNLRSERYEVRDKQAFGEVYERYCSFEGLVEYMLALMLKRIA